MTKKEIVEMLREIEFCGPGDTCPVCRRSRIEKHGDDCRMAKAVNS